MDVSTVALTITTAIRTLGQLREASKKVQSAELKSIIAELADQLSDAKLQLAELKDELVTLKSENQELRSLKEDTRPEVYWGCYRFAGDDQLYCPACYDTKGKRYLTTRLSSTRRQCTVCKTQIGT